MRKLCVLPAVCILLSTALAFSCGTKPQGRAVNEQYDLLLKGGHVIDPANGINETMDVAVRDGKIARVAKNIPKSTIPSRIGEDGAIKIVDVSGYYVTPGIIDIHSHTNYPGGGINARDHCFNSGITTICDAGSMGADNIKDMIDLYYDEDRNIEGAWTPRVLAFLNVAHIGMDGRTDASTFDVDAAVAAARKYPGIVVGYKSYSLGDYDGDVWVNIEACQAAGERTGLPVMYDFQQILGDGDTPPRTYTEFIGERIRPGDIHTHWSAQQFPVLTLDGKPNPTMVEAQRSGVIFDVGHGSGSMVFRNAIPLIEQGFLPNSISTDLHGRNSNSPVNTMTNVMSKFLCMGMTLEQVIECSTINPAREIQHPELGHLTEGAVADIAILDVMKGAFSYTDCSPGQDLGGGGRLEGNRRIRAVMTVFGGTVVHDIIGLTYRPWESIPQDDPYWEGHFRYQPD